MDKNKAIELLKQSLTEIPKLKAMHYDNQEFKLWLNKIETIIKHGFDEDDYNTFSSVQDKYFIDDLVEDNLLQEVDYPQKLNNFETALKSIIQKNEILGMEGKSSTIQVAPESIFQEVPPQAFISHGKKSVALTKLEEFLRTLGIEPLIVKKQPSLDKDLPDKVDLYLSQADFVIILATADDKVGDKLQPRQNVIHEIGLAQKTHPGRIIYLLEEGAEFPSNIRPKVWESFKQRNVMDAFLGIVRELRAYGILKVTKFPIEEHPH